MPDVLDLQFYDDPDLPSELKGSNISYYACLNSQLSNLLCWGN